MACDQCTSSIGSEWKTNMWSVSDNKDVDNVAEDYLFHGMLELVLKPLLFKIERIMKEKPSKHRMRKIWGNLSEVIAAKQINLSLELLSEVMFVYCQR